MEQAKILVVEDEPIVARDIQLSLQRLGYDVPATAASGEEAIRKAAETRPDLVVMDIVLKGKMDGVETAQQLKDRLNVPVIYLTAFADDQTLERAKTTAPAGYMLKPYQPHELRTSIEIALYRSQSERSLRESLRWLATTVRVMGDAVLTTNRGGRLTYLSPAAEALTGWTQKEALGAGLRAILCIEDQGQMREIDDPAMTAMDECRIVDLSAVTLVTKDLRRRPIEGRAAPVVDDAGIVIGAVVVFWDARVPVYSEQERDIDEHLSRAKGIINLCAWCKKVPDEAGNWRDLETFLAEHSCIRFNGGLCPDCMKQCFPQEG
ncbi:MAG TPA: response regulator [Nitrospiraceae bacterium]|nr:response regulator [Nitrospiraceae bacterium]